jgi:hypothetical protein
MGVAPLGRTVLVPVANPASVRPLLTLAAEIARADDGIVEVVTVLGPDMPASVHADAWSQLAEAERLSAGVPVRGRVVHAEDAPTGVFEAVEQTGATLTLMGWRGRSSASDVFSRLIDRLVGRSKVPLAILRPGTQEPRRMLLPISADHLLPGGETGLAVAAGLAARLRASCPEPTTILRTGARDTPLPDDITRLGDRVHHDPRRTHQAVGAFAQPDDLIVAAVAPTVSGLRAATTHLAWSAPDATLLIAVDAGPPVSIDLTDAVDGAGRQPPHADRSGGHAGPDHRHRRPGRRAGSASRGPRGRAPAGRRDRPGDGVVADRRRDAQRLRDRDRAGGRRQPRARARRRGRP